MVDSIIFDMDGTLVNNLKQMVVSWNLTCKRYGWDKEITYEEMKSCMGLNGHDIGVKLFPNIDEDEATRSCESAVLIAAARIAERRIPATNAGKSSRTRTMKIVSCVPAAISSG